MTREELIRRYFDRGDSILEVGASYSPIVPKSDGWNTTVIDHAPQAELVEKYAAMGVKDVDRIETVDFVWQGEALTTIIPQERQGSFDGLIASHVCEHLPDLIAFFRDASALLKPTGLIALALPDKRVCFDFFQPLTTTGDLLAAHAEGRVRHQRRTFFNQAAYFVTRNGEGGWAHSENAAPFHLNNSLWKAQRAYDLADEDPASDYADTSAAVDAYVYGYPLVTMELTRRSFTNVIKSDGKSAPMGDFVNVRKYPAASDKRVTAPNADTLYSTAWIDVGKEPYVLHVPDEHGRFYFMPMLSGWTDVFADPGKPPPALCRGLRHHRPRLEGDVAARHQGRIQIADEYRLGARSHLFGRDTDRLCRRQRHSGAIQADPAQRMGQTLYAASRRGEPHLGHEGPSA